MKNSHFLILLLLGFLLMPSAIFACENNSSKHSSGKETLPKTEKNDCCKKDNHSKTNEHEGCGGKCKHSKCSCISTCNSSISINELKFNNTVFNFSSKKQEFFNYETFISSGFNSLWLIPKIS